jgi:hypothetical protein
VDGHQHKPRGLTHRIYATSFEHCILFAFIPALISAQLSINVISANTSHPTRELTTEVFAASHDPEAGTLIGCPLRRARSTRSNERSTGPARSSSLSGSGSKHSRHPTMLTRRARTSAQRGRVPGGPWLPLSKTIPKDRFLPLPGDPLGSSQFLCLLSPLRQQPRQVAFARSQIYRW